MRSCDRISVRPAAESRLPGPRVGSRITGSLTFLIAFVLLISCAGDLPSPAGRRLVGRRGLTDPIFSPEYLASSVLFLDTAENRISMPGSAGALYAVPYVGGPDRLLVSDVSLTWDRVWDAVGHIYVMRAEKSAPPKTLAEDPPPMASLARIEFKSGDTEEIENVIAFKVRDDGRLFYSQFTGNDTLSDFRMRMEGADRLLGRTSGLIHLAHECVYFLDGPQRTLKTLSDLDTDIGSLATDVDTFELRCDAHDCDQRFIVLSHRTASTRPESVLNLGPRRSDPLPGRGICCLLGFSSSSARYTYSESPAPTGDGRMHILDLETRQDDAVDLPATTIGGIRSAVWRPDGTLVIFSDVADQLFMYSPGTSTGIDSLRTSGRTLRFTQDGRFLLFLRTSTVDAESGTALFFLDTNSPFAPARRASPVGVDVGAYFIFQDGPEVGFWVPNSHGQADLYFINVDSGTSRRIVESVGHIALGARGLVAVVRIDSQDQVGDLVKIELDTGVERMLAHGVSNFALAPACKDCDPIAAGTRLAYVVHGRFASERDGVWAAELE